MRATLLATMAIWGGNLSVVKLLLTQLEPMLLSVLRMSAASLALLALAAWQRTRWPALDRRTLTALGACVLLMVYLNQIAFSLGVQRTTAANAALIIALNPLVSSVGAALLLGERLHGARLAGIVLGFGGVAAVVLNRPGMALGTAGLGDLLVFASVLTWVSGGLIVQRLSARLDTAAISTLVTTAGTLLLALHVLLDPGTGWVDPRTLPLWVWPTAAASGLLATALGALVWNRALQVLGVARAALYVYWVPIFGVGFAVGLLGEPLTVWHAIGLAAVLGGTWLGTRHR